MSNCPICRLSAPVNGPRGGLYRIVCQKCGVFNLAEDVYSDLPHSTGEDDSSRHLLSHKICRSQINNRHPTWDSVRIDHTLSNAALPSVPEQIDNVIDWIGKRTRHFGEAINVAPPNIEAYAGVSAAEAISAILLTLETQGLATINRSSTAPLAAHIFDVALTFEGWSKFDAITKGVHGYTKAFMAMKYDDPELDALVESYFKPAVLQTGYNLLRLDDKPQAGLIDIRLRQEIKTSKFIIADLTHSNLGAYWEAGFAEGIGKPVIYTCRSDMSDKAKLHFDVSHHLTIFWDPKDLDSAVNDLKSAIRFTLPEAKQSD